MKGRAFEILGQVGDRIKAAAAKGWAWIGDGPEPAAESAARAAAGLASALPRGPPSPGSGL